MAHEFETNATITLVKRDGSRVGGIEAGIHSTSILIGGGDWPIEEGDILERARESGIVDRYEVTNPGFRDSEDYGPHFQVKYRLASAQPATTSTVYNLHGPNSRVNIGSTDNSVNTVNETTNRLFADMRQVILTKVEAEHERQPLLAAVTDMEQTAGKPGFLQKYQGFMEVAANHATVIGPFLPALAKLLGAG